MDVPLKLRGREPLPFQLWDALRDPAARVDWLLWRITIAPGVQVNFGVPVGRN